MLRRCDWQCTPSEQKIKQNDGVEYFEANWSFKKPDIWLSASILTVMWRFAAETENLRIWFHSKKNEDIPTPNTLHKWKSGSYLME